jgi:hypothetical protein
MPDITPEQQTISVIYDSIWEWLTTIVPTILSGQPEDFGSIEWIQDHQDGYTPVRPFGTIHVTTSSKMITQQDTTYEFDSDLDMFRETTIIPTTIMLDLILFGGNANDLLTKILMTVGNQETKDYFYQKGIRYNAKSMTSDRTSLINRSYEERAQLRMHLFTLFGNVHLIDRIDQVTVNGTIEDSPIDPITVTTN